MTVLLLALGASPAIRMIRAEGVEFRIYDEEGRIALSVSAPRADCLETRYVAPGEVSFSARSGGWEYAGRSRDGRFDEKGAGELRGEVVLRSGSGDRRGSARLPGAVYDGSVRGEGTTVARLSAPEWGEEAVLAARSYALSPEGDRAVFRGEVAILLPPEAAAELGFPRAAAIIECAEADFSFGRGLERAVFRGGVRLCGERIELRCRRLELREFAGGFDAYATGAVDLTGEELSVRAARAHVSAGLMTAWDGKASWKGWSLSFAELVYDAESGAFTAREGSVAQ